MPKDHLDMTPAGGLFCPVDFSARAERVDCARPNGHAIGEMLTRIRLAQDPGDAFLTDGDIVCWGVSRLCDTPLGCALAHDARFDGWMILLDDGEAARAVIDDRSKCATVPRFAPSPAVFARSQPARMQFLFHLAKALRLIWQENSAIKTIDDLPVEDVILAERMRDADGDLCAMLVAYQLRQSGQHDLWREVLSSDLHALAITLCDCLDEDASPDGVLDALGFVFSDWFSDAARLARVDHASLNALDGRRAGPGRASTGRALAGRSLTDRALTGRALKDLAAGLDANDVFQVSMLPEGLSYLDTMASEIVADPFYSRVADKTNAAHLRQILCESQIGLIREIGFRDAGLARRIFPQTTFETIV